ncbi:MAG TPA: molybdopterin-dependent oxidoreductase, partial [Chthonomonadaceae bacterium]|nr:molybdopterin-dependent oxidoreductase [Chthonomonadaceae bacterium]
SGPGYQSPTSPGMSTRQMLEAAADGKLQVLWLVGAKLLEKYHDPDLARRALERCPFVAVNELTMTQTAEMADLVLPVASVAEKDGTYANCERRIQRIYKAFDLAPDIKPDWLVFSEVAALLGSEWPYFSARDVLKDIAASVPIYAQVNPSALGESGLRWRYPHETAPAAPIAPGAGE